MSTAIIADAHLGGPGGDGTRFVEQLAELPGRGCRHLLLLGDIFHVWVGSRKFETPEIRRVMPALEALKSAGLRLDYIEGNRDFFLADSPYAQVFDSVATEIVLDLGAGRRCLAVHGDGLNDLDRQYLFWRWLSKSAPVRFFVGALPGALARYLIHTTEKKLARTNFKHRKRIPEESIVRWGTRRLSEGYDTLFLGHFHEPRTWPVPGGEIHLIDAWFNHHHIEWLEG